ncbi:MULTISPECIES: hypothetical protein [Sinorhizobium]|uniref:Uncharacterized protein n=1 Tax=Sinorhizobium chiapasense TaxID=501572 RepID=A0ABZ2BGW2_9HYPH|nr:hypothetical protein [Sinorhizobium mexicanum]MBP1884855.1 hypothetical protein [Sinorhizobium mexicanum]
MADGKGKSANGSQSGARWHSEERFTAFRLERAREQAPIGEDVLASILA